MNTERIEEIQKETAYPQSQSVQQALLKVWNETAQKYKAELKAKDERIAELEAMVQNMCAECECAKFADNAIKPSEMWRLHSILKDNK